MRNTVQNWIAPIKRYERHLSAAGMVLGFVIDNFTFGRIDRPRAHLIFACYLLLVALTIAMAHWLQTRADRIMVRKLASEKPRGRDDGGNGEQESVDRIDDRLRPCPARHCAENRDGAADNQSKFERRGRELKRRWQPFAEESENVAVQRDRGSEVPAQRKADPDGKL